MAEKTKWKIEEIHSPRIYTANRMHASVSRAICANAICNHVFCGRDNMRQMLPPSPPLGGAPSCHWGERQGSPSPLAHLEDLNLGTLTLTSDFHPSERSDPLFSVGKWTKDCQLACENSTLHAFVNGRRNGDNKSFCLGVVLVEQQCLTAVQHSRTGVVTDHSRCYQQMEGMLPAGSESGTGQLALHRGWIDECPIKVTTISLLGCRTGYAVPTTPPSPATLAASPPPQQSYSMPISGDPQNPLAWIESRSNPEGGANLGGDPLNPAHLWFSPVSKVHSIPLPHFPPAPPQNFTEIQAEGTGDQHGGAPGRLLKWASWIPLSLCMLLGAGIVLLYRHFTRRAANLRLSRDRAQSDLQLLTHQVSSASIRTQLQINTGDAPCSLAGSLPDERPAHLALRPRPRSLAGVSLPPGPPSSSNDELVIEQDQAASLAGAEADRQGAEARAGGSPTKQKQAVSSSYRLRHAESAGGSQIELERAAPPAGAEADRQGLGERAGGSSTEQKQKVPFDWVDAYRKKHAVSTAAARAKQKPAVVPLSWAEADRQFYADQAARAQMEQKLLAELPLEQAAPLALKVKLAAEALADLSRNVPSTATGGDAPSLNRASPPKRSSSTLSSSASSTSARRDKGQDQGKKKSQDRAFARSDKRPRAVSNAAAALAPCKCTFNITCSVCLKVPGCAINSLASQASDD